MDSALPLGRVQLLRQGGLYIVYSHRLDIATTGKSELQARDRFNELVTICLDGQVTRLGVAAYLESRGWTQRSKRWSPPEA